MVPKFGKGGDHCHTLGKLLELTQVYTIQLVPKYSFLTKETAIKDLKI